jgi:hypothetical protein
MDRAELLNQLGKCNKHLEQNDRNIFEQRKRVDAATASGFNSQALAPGTPEDISGCTSVVTDATGSPRRRNRGFDWLTRSRVQGVRALMLLGLDTGEQTHPLKAVFRERRR